MLLAFKKLDIHAQLYNNNKKKSDIPLDHSGGR